MAEHQPTNDMFDVLASIRRLVSEERAGVPRIEPVPPAPVGSAPAAAPVAEEPAVDPRAAPVAVTEAAAPDAAAPLTFARAESRFVLTPALRVAGEGEGAAPAAAEAPVEAKGMPNAADFIAPQAAPAEAPASNAAPAFAHAAPSRLTQDLDALDQRAASLEETIAELEAAVADISSEFEPDGGEPADIVAEYFPEEGDAPAAFDFAAEEPPAAEAAAPEEPAAAPVAATEVAAPPAAPVWPGQLGPTFAADAAALAEAQPGIVRPHGIMAGFDAISGATEEALDQPVTGEALIPPVLPARVPPLAGTDLAARSGSPFGRAPADEPAGADAPAAGAEDDVAAAEAAEPLAPEAPEEAPRSRLQILRAPQEEPDAPEPGGVPDAADAEPDAPAAPVEEADGLSPLAGEPAAAAVEDDADLPPLFDPLADADYDVEALRDIVAELVRDELRGALGERITRNIRALVRAEMKRMLAEEA